MTKTAGIAKKNTITIVVGRKGCGKSTLAKTLVAPCRRIIILDPQSEYNIGVRVNNFHAFTDMVLRYRFADDFKLTYFPQDKKDIRYMFPMICDVVYDVMDVTFVVEELGYFMSATSFPASFARLVMGSRHQRVSIIGITQRATKIPRDLRSQADKIYTFQQVEPGDVKYISEFMEMKDVNRVKSLTDHRFIEWLPDGTTTIKRVTL
jgi:hypothetical protein